LKNEEIKLKKKDGTSFWGSVTAVAVHDDEGEIKYYDGIVEDITERKKAEDKIERALREKEVLLREIHHRVKNNMQIISSMLNLQSRHIYDERDLGILQDSRNRIKSMSFIHEKLYKAKDLARVDFGEYSKSLSTHLFQFYGVNPANVKLSLDVNDALLDVNTAIPTGLIINELISNSLKHAFPDGRKGTINIGFCCDKKRDGFTVVVKDDGVGLPKDMDIKTTETFGLQLVKILAKQLNGTIELDRSNGTAFKISCGKLG
jgi:two-component sensor histidine kinase